MPAILESQRRVGRLGSSVNFGSPSSLALYAISSSSSTSNRFIHSASHQRPLSLKTDDLKLPWTGVLHLDTTGLVKTNSIVCVHGERRLSIHLPGNRMYFAGTR